MTAFEIAVLARAGPFDEHFFAQALEACPQAISIADVRSAEQPLVFVNHAFELLTGWLRAEVLGRNCRFMQGSSVDQAGVQRIRLAVSQGESATVTIRNSRKDGAVFVNRLMLEPIFDNRGELTHYVGMQSDVSGCDRCKGEMQSSAELRQSRVLPGPVALADRIEQSLSRARALGTRCALLLIELSPPGRELPTDAARSRARLFEVSRVIGENLPVAAASLSGLSETCVGLLLDPSGQAPALAELAQELLRAVNHHLATRQDPTACHIGVAIGPIDGDSADELCAAAGRALSRARLRSPKGELSFFANAQDAGMLQSRQMHADLAEALARQQFSLVYQPIVRLDTAQLVGFEALIRWVHPVRGPIPPSDFIPAAEASGMIVPISNWVIERALSQLAVFDRIGNTPVRMFINISACQLEQPGFIDSLREQVSRHGIVAGRVELEITERTVTDQSPATLQTLHALRQLGISVAVDDFGTGYSNLHTLTQLPIDTLKIDMSFTQAVTHSGAAASVSRMIADLGRTLDLCVVVEGIETEGQLNHFRALACTYGQGYLLSRPLAADAACDLLSSGRPLFGAAAPQAAPHLLLLDDDESILATLGWLLRNEGYRVHATTSPDEAFEILATCPVGVVLSDQQMPRMSGAEFLRQVKKLHPNTVRMVLSGANETHSVQAALNDGAAWRYLSKPYADADLREQIQLAFREHEALREAAQKQAEAERIRTRLESEVSRRDEQLAIKLLALEAAHDTLAILPIPVVGVDLEHIVVMSNLEADRTFGHGASLMGELLSSVLPGEVEQALSGRAPFDLVLSGHSYRLHVQALMTGAAASGHLLSLVPRSAE